MFDSRLAIEHRQDGAQRFHIRAALREFSGVAGNVEHINMLLLRLQRAIGPCAAFNPRLGLETVEVPSSAEGFLAAFQQPLCEVPEAGFIQRANPIRWAGSGTTIALQHDDQFGVARHGNVGVVSAD